jgi:hypothetical protein
MSARSNSIWWVDAWAPGDSIKSHSGIKTVYRRKQVVATFSPTLITFHKATDEDLRQMLKLAKKKWGDDLKIYGDAAFRRKLTRIAAEESIVVANPELAPFQQYLLWPMQRALKAPASRLDKAFDAVLARAAGEFAIISNRFGSAAARSFELYSNALEGVSSRFDQGMIVTERRFEREEAERHIAAQQAQADMLENEARRRDVERAAHERAAESRRLAEVQLAKRQLEVRDQVRAEQERRVAEQAAKREFEVREQGRIEQERQALKLAEVNQVYQALRSGSLVIVEDESKLSVHIAATQDKHLNATAMIAQEHHRQIMLSHARAHREAAEKQLARAEALKARAAMERIPILLREAKDIAKGRWLRPAAKAKGIEEAVAVVGRIGRAFESALKRNELEKAETARMYEVWEAFELIDSDRGIGSLENNVLTVFAYQEGRPRNILLKTDELHDANHKINNARARLDDLYDAARDGRIMLNVAGAPTATTSSEVDLAIRASYFWHMKRPRQLILDAIDLGNRERQATVTSVDDDPVRIIDSQLPKAVVVATVPHLPSASQSTSLPSTPVTTEQVKLEQDPRHSDVRGPGQQIARPVMPPPGWGGDLGR